MDLDELASLVTPKTRMLIINTPQNPTGGVLTAEDIDFVASWPKSTTCSSYRRDLQPARVRFHHVSRCHDPHA